MATITLSFKGMVLKKYPLDDGETLIGSDSACAVPIDSLAVAPRHARVETHAGMSTVEDMGTSEGTFVNHKRIQGPTPLHDGDVLGVGKHTLTFNLPEASAEEPAFAAPSADPTPLNQTTAPTGAWLQILSGHNLGKTISLNRALTNIGKKGIQTAVIARRNGGYFLSLLEGPPTMLVQGAPLGERSRHLQDQDVIQIGNIKMQFYLHE